MMDSSDLEREYKRYLLCWLCSDIDDIIECRAMSFEEFKVKRGGKL